MSGKAAYITKCLNEGCTQQQAEEFWEMVKMKCEVCGADEDAAELVVDTVLSKPQKYKGRRYWIELESHVYCKAHNPGRKEADYEKPAEGCIQVLDLIRGDKAFPELANGRGQKLFSGGKPVYIEVGPILKTVG